ncbi:MAG TPA: hypothetical protein VFG83_14030 [Kofleriaceae bacterium]|nr:hypothetical protein [Kofleriaceae bacterium]
MSTDRSRELFPWQKDATSLRAETAHDLPTIHDTAAALARAVATANHPRRHPKEKRFMSIIKTKPLIAAAIAAALLLLVTPAAYALVHHFILDIDPDQPAEVIEQNVRDQLTAAGVNPTSVKVQKQDDRIEVKIRAENEQALPELGVSLGSDGTNAVQARVRLAMDPDAMSEDDSQKLTALLESEAFGELLSTRDPEMADDDFADAIDSFFADHGFANITAEVSGADVTLSAD